MTYFKFNSDMFGHIEIPITDEQQPTSITNAELDEDMWVDLGKYLAVNLYLIDDEDEVLIGEVPPQDLSWGYSVWCVRQSEDGLGLYNYCIDSGKANVYQS